MSGAKPNKINNIAITHDSMNKTEKKERLTLKPHYYFPLRLLIEFYNNGKLPDVRSVYIESEYGRVARIVYKDGTRRMFYGNCLGINNHDSVLITKDKGYTKYFLNILGYTTPVGKVFLMPERIKKIDRNLSRYGFSDYSTSEKIYSYIQSTIGYPCFIKPNRGTKGIGVYKCFNNLDVQLALREYEKQCSDIVIVEQFVDLPDYRVNVLGDKVICCYLRKPLAVTGDGKSTIGELIQQKQDTFIKKAKPPLIDINDLRISQNLKREDYSFHAVLSSGQKLNLHDFSNLPSGGEAVDYTEVIHPYWKDLCVRVTKELGLLISGIDLFCAHIEKPNTRYSILEINSTPGLENYAALGKKQEETVRHLYMKLFNQSNPHFQL